MAGKADIRFKSLWRQSLRHPAILSAGILTGISQQLTWLAGALSFTQVTYGIIAGRVVLGAVMGALLFAAAHAALVRLAVRSSIEGGALERFRNGSAASFLIYVVLSFGSVGLRPHIAVVLPLVALQLIWLGALYLKLLGPTARRESLGSLGFLSGLFVISGFAALVYQVAWQRALFTVFGVNIESITVIVSVFMFGLGLGSLAGGKLSARFPRHLPWIFFGCEAAIGLFGLISLPLIDMVGTRFQTPDPLQLAVPVYLLLALPTMFMGATLPVLVTYLNRQFNQLGRSLGWLYFVNTIGSALACFVTSEVLFVLSGLSGSVHIAAGLNFVVGCLVVVYARALETSPKFTPAPGTAGAEA